MTDHNELSPFEGPNKTPAGVNSGAVSVEQERAIAQARGQIQLAKMFPRSIAQAREELLEACADPEFAQEAFYSVPNRGSGPSIRFAEEIARCYGNFDYGHVELSRSEGKSEIEVYAWDKEKNNYSRRQITVNHVVDTKQGPRKLTQQADIDNRIANIAAKQVRGRILALVSKPLVANGVAACKETLANGGGGTISQRVSQAQKAFTHYGVKAAMLESYLGHSLDNATSDDLADLLGVYNALRDGAKVADYFEAPEKETPELKPSTLGAKAAEAAKDKPKAEPKPKTEKPKPAPEPEPKPEPAEPVDSAPDNAQNSAEGQGDDDSDLF